MRLLTIICAVTLALGCAAAKPEEPLTPVAIPPRGAAHAPVTIYQYSDFQCGPCAKASATLKQLVEKEYRGKVRLFFRHYPLPQHPYARGAARATVAAAMQGKFWEMHDLLFAHQAHLGKQLYLEAAYELKLDVLQFERDLKASRAEFTIAQDVQQGTQLGIRATPTFVINGRFLQGNAKPEQFRQAINAALKEVQHSTRTQ